MAGAFFPITLFSLVNPGSGIRPMVHLRGPPDASTHPTPLPSNVRMGKLPPSAALFHMSSRKAGPPLAALIPQQGRGTVPYSGSQAEGTPSPGNGTRGDMRFQSVFAS